MDELLGKIITGLITAAVTLIVCLINNAYQLKRDREQRDTEHRKELEQIKDDYSKQIIELKTDFYAKFQSLESLVSTMIQENKHALELIKMEIKILQEKQEKYNHLQERTFNLEKAVELHEEKIKVANNRIQDIENEKKN